MNDLSSRQKVALVGECSAALESLSEIQELIFDEGIDDAVESVQLILAAVVETMR